VTHLMYSAGLSSKKRPRVQVQAGTYLLAALCILILPLNWLMGWFAAVCCHEAGHMLALAYCGIPIHEINIGCTGARIFTGPITAKQELLCAAAGPISSFMLLSVAMLFPAAAMIGLIQGLFNLLPIYPFDGGRIVKAIRSILSKNQQQI